jgi:hypothetical protein
LASWQFGSWQISLARDDVVLVARVSTSLDAAPSFVWEAVKRLDTFRYVTRGVLGFRVAGDPGELRKGMVVRGRLLFFHAIPAWMHEIRVLEVDESRMEILTSEGGGPVSNWGHRITVAPAGGRTRYTDEIEIDAGAITPLVWAYAHVFYRYRQARWRRLARTLPRVAPAG